MMTQPSGKARSNRSGASGAGIARVVGLWLLVVPASGADFVVDTLVDENDGVGVGDVSLRDAINAANANGDKDNITFSVTGTITLTADLPNVTESLVITGPGAASLTIDGADSFRALALFGNTNDMTVTDLTIANCRAVGGAGGNSNFGGGGGGAAGIGAALYLDDGSIRCEDVTFDGNDVVGGAGGAGADGGTGNSGAGGGGVGGAGANGSTNPGGNGGGGGFLGGAGGTGGSSPTAGGTGGGGGAGNQAPTGVDGATGGFAGGGGGGGYGSSSGGGNGANGGYGGGGGGGANGTGNGTPGTGGTFGGNAGEPRNGGGGAGLGGAIFARNGNLTLVDCTLKNNSATGGAAGGASATAGQGKGGAIFLHPDANAVAENLTFGTGGEANSASDDTASSGDDDDTFGTFGNIPSVNSVARDDTTPTNADTVDYTVTFSEDVTGVGTADFSLSTNPDMTNPLVGTSVQSVNMVNGSTYTVTIDTGTGDGTISLNVEDDDSIQDTDSTPIGGMGTANGRFVSNVSYSLDRTAPTIAGTNVPVGAGESTNAASVTITIEYDEDVTGFTNSDVTLDTTGDASTGSVSIATVSTRVINATINGLSGTGDVTLSVKDAAVADTAGNNSAAANDVVSFQLDRTAPKVLSITAVETEIVDVATADFTVTFTEAVEGFAPGDVTVNHVGTSNAGVDITAQTDAVYTVTVTGLSGNGSFWITIPSGVVTDDAGNTSTLVALSSAVMRTQTESGGNDDDDPDDNGDDDDGNNPGTPTDPDNPGNDDNPTTPNDNDGDGGTGGTSGTGDDGDGPDDGGSDDGTDTDSSDDGMDDAGNDVTGAGLEEIDPTLPCGFGVCASSTLTPIVIFYGLWFTRRGRRNR